MTRVAAIDMGTNSTRLLVADVDGHGRDAKLVTVERRTKITRLGQGVDRDRTLHPDAIERTLAVLREYRGVIDDLGVERVRATATSAARDAANRDDLFDPAEAMLGVRPGAARGRRRGPARVHRRDREPRPSPARISSSTSAAARPSSSSAPTSPKACTSIDIGCVRLTEQFLHSDPPTAGGVESGGLGRARPARRRRPGDARRRGTRRRSSVPRERSGRSPRSSSASTPNAATSSTISA